jgi:hypothetical protein
MERMTDITSVSTHLACKTYIDFLLLLLGSTIL